jgi:hypothetical protein
MWNDYNDFIKKEYFKEKHWVKGDETAAEFDIQVDEKRCSQFKKKGAMCNLCFNTALLEKLQQLSSLERLNFVNYQINKYDDPLDWLKRFRAFLNDNEDNFDSFNFKIQQEFLEITRQGIQQLSKKQDKSPTSEEPDDF